MKIGDYGSDFGPAFELLVEKPAHVPALPAARVDEIIVEGEIPGMKFKLTSI